MNLSKFGLEVLVVKKAHSREWGKGEGTPRKLRKAKTRVPHRKRYDKIGMKKKRRKAKGCPRVWGPPEETSKMSQAPAFPGGTGH